MVEEEKIMVEGEGRRKEKKNINKFGGGRGGRRGDGRGLEEGEEDGRRLLW